MLMEFEGQTATVYEKRGLFKTEFVYDPVFIQENDLTFKFSAFQIPALFLDYFFRKSVISLNEFLKIIPESKT